jgi:uncharacterized protein YjdB
MSYYCNRNNSKPLLLKFIKAFIIFVIAVLILNFILQNSIFMYRRTIIMPFSLHLNKSTLVMVKGEEYHLYVVAINKRVSFSSSNFRIAGVNFNGRVFAYNTGTAYIIAKVDGKLLKCKVQVIDINKKSLIMKQTSTYHLKIEGTNSYRKWSSSSPEVATVNAFGKVRAKAKGTAEITAKVKGKTLKCIVKVR